MGSLPESWWLRTLLSSPLSPLGVRSLLGLNKARTATNTENQPTSSSPTQGGLSTKTMCDLFSPLPMPVWSRSWSSLASKAEMALSPSFPSPLSGTRFLVPVGSDVTTLLLKPPPGLPRGQHDPNLQAWKPVCGLLCKASESA